MLASYFTQRFVTHNLGVGMGSVRRLWAAGKPGLSLCMYTYDIFSYLGIGNIIYNPFYFITG